MTLVFLLIEKSCTNLICVGFVVASLVVTFRLFHIDCNILLSFFCWCVCIGRSVVDMLPPCWASYGVLRVLLLRVLRLGFIAILPDSGIRMAQGWSDLADLPCEFCATSRGYML